jgi:adenine deaminase
MSPAKTKRARLVDAAMGRMPCDLVLKNARILDVFTLAWSDADVAVSDGTIVGLEPGLTAKRTVDLRGRALVPGFVDAHVHVESSLLVPEHFAALVLPKGTTTAICDPHELANVIGVSGIEWFLSAAERVPLDLRVMISSCVPATHMETNGGGVLGADALAPLRKHGRALGLAEVMNVPGVINADPSVLDKIDAFEGSPIDGHCPLVRGRALSAYAAAGIRSCHESSELEEAREKLTKGISVWIREGSVAKDLHALAPLLSVETSTSMGFCTDDRNPLDIAAEGHVDFLIRQSIALGVRPEVAYRAASWSVARHYGLRHLGAVAPGFDADLVVLEDVATCAVGSVYRRGVPTSELDFVAPSDGATAEKTVRATVPAAEDLVGPSGTVHVIGVRAGRILTEHAILPHDAPGVARLSVLERYGHGRPPANGYCIGFGEELHGAIASSVGHDSHNLIVVGREPNDMRAALAALIECGGGFVVVRDGAVQAKLALPVGGLMSREGPLHVETALRELHRASRAIGCALGEPFLQLAFLSLPVIPSLKLTDRGLVDVEKFEIISVSAA